MTDLLVVSPHFDDAVFSCGQLLAGARDPLVVTVCTAIPDATLTAYDQACGFESSPQAAEDRRVENDRAMNILGCRTENLDVLDGQYKPISYEELVDRLLVLFRGIPDREATTVVIPLGLHHTDHLLVSDAALQALGPRARTIGPVWIYEELPYRVEHPEEVVERLAHVADRNWTIRPIVDPPPVGPMNLKAAARACYRSQQPEWEHALFVPERIHWAHWSRP